MKRYTAPAVTLMALSARDVLMVSKENETPKDYVDHDGLVISGIEGV